MLLKYTSIIYTDYTWNVHNGIDKSLDQYNQVIFILLEIYFANLYRFPDTENLLYIDLKTCQYHLYISGKSVQISEVYFR